MIQFILNNKEVSTDLPAGTTVLDFVRYHKNLTGTKIGCREGDCGACVVLIGSLKNEELIYQSFTSCLTPLGNVHQKHVVTIEGLNMAELNPVQEAIQNASATQCGFCTPGFVVSMAGFCLNKNENSYQNALAAIDGNICRCTGYKSIERAATEVANCMKERKGEEPATYVSRKQILPPYFLGIKERLRKLSLATNGFLKEERFRFVGGGTDLYVQQHDEIKKESTRFLLQQEALKGIYREENRCLIGGAATVTDLAESEILQACFPKLKQYIKLISSTPIRNMATIAGNFINASPIGDLTIFFLALDARVIFNDGKSKREMLLKKLYKGYKILDKKPGEYIEQVWFDLPADNCLFHFEKVSKRTHLDIASVNSAMQVKMNGELIEEAYLSAGGVGPVPLFLEQTTKFLKGKAIKEALVAGAIETAQSEISPISDARGTESYKRILLAQLMKAHFITLFPKLDIEKLLAVSIREAPPDDGR